MSAFGGGLRAALIRMGSAFRPDNELASMDPMAPEPAKGSGMIGSMMASATNAGRAVGGPAMPKSDDLIKQDLVEKKAVNRLFG